MFLRGKKYIFALNVKLTWKFVLLILRYLFHVFDIGVCGLVMMQVGRASVLIMFPFYELFGKN